jgi:hypothetical protein
VSCYTLDVILIVYSRFERFRVLALSSKNTIVGLLLRRDSWYWCTGMHTTNRFSITIFRELYNNLATGSVRLAGCFIPGILDTAIGAMTSTGTPVGNDLIKRRWT